jgi:hypothetical protein
LNEFVVAGDGDGLAVGGEADGMHRGCRVGVELFGGGGGGFCELLGGFGGGEGGVGGGEGFVGLG